MLIAIGSVATWQIVLAVALAVALFFVLVWLAGRIYGNAVTRTGTRVRLTDALRPL
jgi:ABC-2 type transport system permease protein